MSRHPYVETVVELVLPCSKELAFALTTNLERFPDFFSGFGPIPRVVKCELITPLPVRVGSKRHITNDDGSVLEEDVEIFDPGEEHRYRIEKGFVPPFSKLIHAAVGHWTFEDVDGGARVRWRYRFELQAQWAPVLAGFIVHVFFKQAMIRCLRNIKATFY